MSHTILKECIVCKKVFSTKKSRLKKYCSRICYHHKTPEQRFYEKFSVNLENKCWEWHASFLKDGYGCFIHSGQQSAHRVSWVLHKGEIPEGLWVLHACDNRKCVNPDHLFLGTAAENNRDMMVKGRNRQLYGEQCKHAKLSQDDVIKIRKLHADGICQRRIAERFSVGFKAINKIVKRQRWKHLP